MLAVILEIEWRQISPLKNRKSVLNDHTCSILLIHFIKYELKHHLRKKYPTHFIILSKPNSFPFFPFKPQIADFKSEVNLGKICYHKISKIIVKKSINNPKINLEKKCSRAYSLMKCLEYKSKASHEKKAEIEKKKCVLSLACL